MAYAECMHKLSVAFFQQTGAMQDTAIILQYTLDVMVVLQMPRRLQQILSHRWCWCYDKVQIQTATVVLIFTGSR